MASCNVDLKLVQELEDKCVDIRKNLVNFIYRIGMGHLGGELSMVDMAVALYYNYMNYDPKNTQMENRDRFVLSKGHCSETLYTIFSDMGMYTMDYMVEHYHRKYHKGQRSRLYGRQCELAWRRHSEGTIRGSINIHRKK